MFILAPNNINFIRAVAAGIILAAIGLLVAPSVFHWALQKRFEPVPPPERYPNASNELEAERQDLDYLEQLMHLDRSFSSAARAQFERERTALTERSVSLTKAQFRLAIDHLVTLANNGHTSTLASQRASSFGRAQVRFAWFGDGLYIVRAKSDFKDLLAARVLMIDGRDLPAATAAARPYVTGIDRYAKWYSLPLLETPELLHAIWSDADPEVLRLRVLTPEGKQTDVRVTIDAPHENHNKLVPIRDIAPAQIPDDTNGWLTLLPDNNLLPPSLREPNRSLFSSQLPKDNLYIRINQALPDSYGPLKRQLAELMQRSAGHAWQHIILDLRFNTGGNYLETAAFTHDLHRHLRREGKLSVLIGNMTFSAAIVTAARAKYFTPQHVELVGESVGDRDQYWAERGERLRLPNSGIQIGYATAMHDSVHECYDPTRCYWLDFVYGVPAGTLEPDRPITWSFADYAKRQDTVLNAVLGD
jgi:hypothetical protein